MTDRRVYLGDLVEDCITGFKGIITGYTVHMHNTDRAHVQPQGLKEDGQPREGVWQDVVRLSLVEAEVIARPVFALLPFDTGDEVADTLSKLKGVVVGHAYYLTGCVHLGVQSPVLKDGLPVDPVWAPFQQFKIIKVAKKQKEKTTGGGPMPAPQGVRDSKI